MSGSRADISRIVVVALIALCLRPFLAGPGPVLDQIASDTDLGPTGLSLITLGPLALIGLGALAAPSIQRLAGARVTVLVALALVALGSTLRIVPSGMVMIATAAVCGLGVALLQAIVPALIRDRYTNRYGAVANVYSACLLAGGAIGAQAVPLIAERTSWPVGLAAMAVPAMIAFAAVWVMPPLGVEGNITELKPIRSVFVERVTWHLVACFAVMNASYATVIAWIGPQFAARAMDAREIGFLMAVMAICQAVAALIVPPLISRRGNRRAALLFSIAMQASGFGMLIVEGISPLLIVLVMGVGLGGTFALMMLAILDCSTDRDTAVRLGAAVQGVGFILNALAPLIAAVAIERTGGFSAAWMFHLGLLAIAVPLVIWMPRGAISMITVIKI